MSPNLERYGVSTIIPQGLNPERVITYFTTYYQVVEVVRPSIMNYMKPSITIYLFTNEQKARGIQEKIFLGDA